MQSDLMQVWTMVDHMTFWDPSRVLRRVEGELDRLVKYGVGPVPYSVLGPMVGLTDIRARELGKLLGQILRDDHGAGKPLRSALVINKAKGRPGSQFFDLCRSLGYQVGASEQDELDFWSQELVKLGL